MCYKNIRAKIKWWDPHTKKLKYCSYEKFDEHNNKFGKVLSPGSELVLGKNISTLPTLKIDLSYHPFIKDDIFEVNDNFPLRGNTIGIIVKYCDHHKISYISHSRNDIP